MDECKRNKIEKGVIKRPFLSDPKLLQPLQESLKPLANKTIAVGLSGGADSAMLLIAASEVASQLGITIKAVHIHHGIFAQADDWANHACALAQMLGHSCEVIKVKLQDQNKLGIEASARNARYEAFLEFSNKTHIVDFLLAHHVNDQAETVLLRLLRGTGVHGLAAMKAHSQRNGLHFYRPWLGVNRERILDAMQAFSKQNNWQAINDPSNVDDKYTRAAVRTLLVPSLNKRWPSWRSILSRQAKQMADNALLLDDLALTDFKGLAPSHDNKSFSLALWRELAAHRQANVLRYWLRINQLQMPVEARLKDWLRQLRGLHALGHDRFLKWEHEHVVIRCVKGKVFIED